MDRLVKKPFGVKYVSKLAEGFEKVIGQVVASMGYAPKGVALTSAAQAVHYCHAAGMSKNDLHKLIDALFERVDLNATMQEIATDVKVSVEERGKG